MHLSTSFRVYDLRLGRVTDATPTRDWKLSAIRARGILKVEDARTQDIAKASAMLWRASRALRRAR